MFRPPINRYDLRIRQTYGGVTGGCRGGDHRVGITDDRWVRLGDVALVVFAAAFSISQYVFGVRYGLLGSHTVYATAIGTASAAALLARRRLPTVVSIVCSAVHALTFAPVQLLIALFSVGLYGRSRLRIAIAGLVGVAASLTPWRSLETDDTARALTYAVVIVGGALLLGVYGGSRQAEAAQLAERARRAERENRLLAERARVHERARIAREMHDVVTHKVSLMVLDAGALQASTQQTGTRQAGAERDPDLVADVAGRIRATGRQALQELREILGVLRPPDHDAPRAPQPTLADLPRMVDEAGRSGARVQLSVTGASRPLEWSIERAAYRVTQEALTNAGKHAAGAPIRIALGYGTDDLTINVTNGPAAAATAPHERGPSSGLGLIGLEERVRLQGGTLRTTTRPDGGFGLLAVLPARERAA